jgi:isopropylmalate/homocitrate/citramalate synthase
MYGCSAANGTFLGLGERTGNPPIEGLILEYMSLRGDDPSIETRVITEVARYYRTEIKYDIPKQYPFVGNHFNSTLAGIHIDAMAKDKKIYNIFDTEKILGVRPGVRLNDKSGRAGVAYWINEEFGLEGDAQISKGDPRVGALDAWIKKQFDEEGRVATISDKEMMREVRKHLPQVVKAAKKRSDSAKAARKKKKKKKRRAD